MQKRVIITIVDGFHLRYLVDAGVLDELGIRGISMLILTIPVLESRFETLKQKYGEKVKIQMPEDVPLTRRRRAYLSLVMGTNKKLSETVNYKSEITRIEEPVKHYFLSVIRLFAGSAAYKAAMKWTGRSFSSAYYKKLLTEFKPDLVIFSTPGQKMQDLPLLYECIQKGIKSISPVYSWDNLTAKGPFVFKVDKLIVWNQIMKDEAILYHDFAPNDVDISGVPVFDPYVAVINEGDRSLDFKKKLGLRLDKPLISVTTVPRIFFGECHRTMIERILRFMEQGLISDADILLRPHPKDVTDYSSLKNSGRVVIDTYGSAPDDTMMKWIPQEDNIAHLARTMKYSDIVINIASTITIDASCFDTPVINIAYDMKQSEADYVGSIRRFYSYTHYKHVVNSNAAYIVYSDDELVTAINAYFKDRSLHSKERLKLVEQQTGILDGNAHKRVTDSILKMLG